MSDNILYFIAFLFLGTLVTSSFFIKSYLDKKIGRKKKIQKDKKQSKVIVSENSLPLSNSSKISLSHHNDDMYFPNSEIKRQKILMKTFRHY